MVTNYINNFCKYRLDKLQNVVYLISKNALRTIEIDVPFAFVSGITEPPIALKTTSIGLTEDDTLDERYEFTHTLSFTVDGYANYTDFQGRYYAIVKNYEGKYWLLNPLFPSKVTYEYTLDASGSRTEFTMATASNHPTLLAVGFDAPTPYECNGYNLCGIDRLFLNEKDYSNVDNNGRVYYTNDGFKEVVFDKNSATFKEIFNGDTVQHRIDFNIKFDDYKSSWHYNLLEFVDNTYSSVISTKCGTYIMSGFNFGLQPSFSVSADETTTPNNIGITLVDAANSGSFINLVSGTSFNPITTTEWIYTSENDGWECVGNGIARYLLKKEVDAFGNPSGHYLAYSGYTSYFEEKGLIIDGEFDEEKTFISSECVESGCTLSTSLLNTIKMRPQTCTLFELQSESDWDITSSSSFLLFNPSSGVANSAYTVEICNNVSQSSLSVSGEFSINYCNNKHFDVAVQISKQIDTCFPQGQEFNINALAQWVNIPTNCCVDTVENSAITNVQIGNGWVKVYVPQNFTFTARTFTLVFTMCNGTTVDVIINQDRIYERWVSAGLVCCLTQQCTLLKRYTGLTPSSIDTYTYETQFVDCAPSPDCSNGSYWLQTTTTTCDNGRKYYIEEEMIWDGTSWVASGNQRIGAETEDSPAECSGGTPTYEYRWVLTDEWECNGTTKRYLYKYQQRISGSSDAWSDVIPTRTSYNGEGTMAESAITNSTDCGYVPPTEPQYKWVRMDITTDYICDECPIIPTGFTAQYLTLVPRSASTTFMFSNNTINYSLDSGNTWTSLAANTATPSVGVGDKIMFKASGLTINYGIGKFSGSSQFDVEGNAMSMIYGDDFIGQTSLSGKNYALEYLFSGSSVVSAENLVLPATELASWCYSRMFKNCIYLTKVPTLSATTMAYGCYANMFEGCTSLTTVPSDMLPSTTLADRCYSEMFYDCSGLTAAPQLLATTLVDSCYSRMFAECSALTEAPILSAETLASYCYNGMFYNCTNLSSVTCLATDISASNCTNYWLGYVPSTGTFYKNPNMTSWGSGYSGIPNGWTIIDYSN